jgi:hypothetical protein
MHYLCIFHFKSQDFLTDQCQFNSLNLTQPYNLKEWPTDLGTLRKLTQIAGDSIGDSRDLLVVPKMFRADFRDVPDRFQGCSGQISGYSGHISSVLTIMEIDDWTI